MAQAVRAGRRFVPWMVAVGAVTMLAGVLFGYDQGIISGALTFIQRDFALSDLMTEVVTSWVTLGALAGALAGGVLADRIGRRRTNERAGVLFAAGALLEAAAPGTGVLVAGRLVIGLGVGMASVAAPLYAAEMAPAASRGRYVSMYQLAITVGILVAYVVDDVLSSSGEWRLMLGLAVVPGVALVLGFLVMPETPRWLVGKGRRTEAEAALAKVRGGDADTEASIDAMAAELAAEPEQASWREIFGPGLRRPLLVGLGLATFQQVTGINAVIYYADDIFGFAGFATPEEQARATLYAVGVVNVLATLIAVAYVDRFGRKPLLQAGLVGMTVSLVAVGGAFAFLDERPPPLPGGGPPPPSTVGIITVIALVVFIASFAFSLGPVVWTVINEIYPGRVRGRMVAVATAANWGAAFLVSQFFLTLIADVGKAATFWLFAGLCVVAALWIARYVPETKGRSLEDIQAMWDDEAARASGPVDRR